MPEKYYSVHSTPNHKQGSTFVLILKDYYYIVITFNHYFYLKLKSYYSCGCHSNYEVTLF